MPVILKRYFRSPADPRDRLGHEYGFLSLCLSGGIRSIPKPLAADPDLGMALYSEVLGRALRPEEISAVHVAAAMAFVAEVNRCGMLPEAQRLPLASEACFSLGAHVATVARRIDRLVNISPEDALDRDALDFVRGPVHSAWRALGSELESQTAAHPRLSLPLSADERVISPSDFGFHNALVSPEGKLSFLDFEYAGWDDPAKLLGDFFGQPAKPIPFDQFKVAIDVLSKAVAEPEWMAHRAQILWPLYQLKWVTILLNEFLPVGRARRAFSDGTAVSLERRQIQLSKAQSALERMQPFSARHKACPPAADAITTEGSDYRPGGPP